MTDLTGHKSNRWDHLTGYAGASALRAAATLILPKVFRFGVLVSLHSNNRRIKGLIRIESRVCNAPEKLLAILRFFVKNVSKPHGDKAK
jgi:hypothetical protein